MLPEKFEKEISVEEISQPKQIDLSEERLSHTLIVLALPTITENLLHTTVHFSDTLIVGWLRDEVMLAASLLGGVLMFISSAPFFALTVAANSLISRSWGARNFEKAKDYAGQCLSIAFLFGLLIPFCGIPLAAFLLKLIGAAPDVISIGTPFLRVLLLSASLGPPMWVANGIIRGTGDTKTPMVISIIMNIVNIIVSIGLTFGIGSWPGMGFIGVAWGTVVARTLGGLLSLGVLVTGRTGLHLPFRMLWTWKRALFREVWKLAAPTLVERLIWSASFSIFASIVAKLGTTALAAHNIALHVESLAFMPATGAAYAISAFVGQSVGAGKPDIGEMAVKRTLKWSTLLMGGLGLSFLVFGRSIAKIFGSTPEVVHLAGIILQISALEHPLMACAMILSSTLQGAGDTRSPLYVMVVCILLFRFGLVYTFAILFGWGLPGVWLATAIDWGGRSLGLWGFFSWGRWKTLHAPQ